METQAEKRRLLIDLAQRHQRPGSGSSSSFLANRTVQMKWTDLTPILTGLPWAVVGAAATRLYMAERVTQDLDITVLAADSIRVGDTLAAAGFERLGKLSIGGATWRAPEGQTIDVIEGHESWWSEALSEAQTNRDAQGLPILPLRYLVLMKIKSGRVQDLADITRMLGQADEASLNAVRFLFRKLSPVDLEDLESLITLGKLELGNE